MKEYIQRIKNIFKPPILKSFEGTFVGINQGIYTTKECMKIDYKITNGREQLIYNVSFFSEYGKFSCKLKPHITELNNSNILRRDGFFVRKSLSGTYPFNTIVNVADVQLLLKDKLIRRLYYDYWFKGIFGGYWGGKQLLVYERCDNCRLDELCDVHIRKEKIKINSR